jgi:hypothetical protein
VLSAIFGAILVVFAWSMVTANGRFGYRPARAH